MEKTTPDTLESIDLTPHWPSMFRLAVQLCRAGLERGEGRDMVIEMLEFGARLEAAQAAVKAQAEAAIAKASTGQEGE